MGGSYWCGESTEKNSGELWASCRRGREGQVRKIGYLQGWVGSEKFFLSFSHSLGTLATILFLYLPPVWCQTWDKWLRLPFNIPKWVKMGAGTHWVLPAPPSHYLLQGPPGLHTPTTYPELSTSGGWVALPFII